MQTPTHIRYVQDDTSPPLRIDIQDAAGAAADLTGATVVLRLRRIGSKTATEITATPDASPGTAMVLWSAGDLAAAGEFEGEVHITWPDGDTQTIDEKILMQIRSRL